MTDFNDYDPEDAWDDNDSEDQKLSVMERIVEALEDRSAHDRLARRDDALRLLGKLTSTSKRRNRRHLKVLRERLEAF